VPETPGQFLPGEAKAVVQFGQQPALFERRLGLGGLHQAGGDQGFGLFPRPATGPHGVSAQTAQGANPLVAIDDDEGALGRLLHHHDGNLLADLRQGRQQSPLGFGADDL
jgi:hypothetical protein